MNKTDLARAIVREYIELGIKHQRGYSKRFIATDLQSKHPDVFKDVEEARSCVRRVTGAKGRKVKMDRQLEEDFALLENPMVECELKPFVVPIQYKKSFIINDIHSKFHDRKALEVAVNHASKQNCDIVIINGDLFDFYQFSRFDKNNRIRSEFFSEREWVQDFLLLLQKTFGKVVFKKGNHDLRREQFIQKLSGDMPELQGLESISDYVMFDGSTVEVVEDYNIIEFGKLNLIHGHEYQGGGGIHVAYNRLNKAMDNIMSGHSHVTQSNMKKTITGKYYGSWAVGCMCSLSPRYVPQNNWNHGFAIVERDSTGDFVVDNRRIIDGRIF
jgi:predicted phosphodiesterase